MQPNKPGGSSHQYLLFIKLGVVEGGCPELGVLAHGRVIDPFWAMGRQNVQLRMLAVYLSDFVNRVIILLVIFLNCMPNNVGSDAISKVRAQPASVTNTKQVPYQEANVPVHVSRKVHHPNRTVIENVVCRKCTKDGGGKVGIVQDNLSIVKVVW